MAEQNKKPDAPADDKPADDAVTLTKEELQKLIDDNRAEAAKEAKEKARARAKKKKQQQPEPEAEDDEEDEDEDPNEIIRKAETRAAVAEQERDQARKDALMAKVENKLNAYLALNMREFVGNAPDIMLHIEKALSADAKDGEIARLIESHSKAFAERTKSARKPASGAPLGGARSPRMSGLTGNSDDEPTRREQPGRAASAPLNPFFTANWHG